MTTQNRARRATLEGTDRTSLADSPAERGIAQDNGPWRKFAEPRGWAVKWDGFGLPGVIDRRADKAQVDA